MFTIEHDHDETVTTVLDNDGKYEDLQLIIGDKSVYIRQYRPDICISKLHPSLNISIERRDRATSHRSTTVAS